MNIFNVININYIIIMLLIVFCNSILVSCSGNKVEDPQVTFIVQQPEDSSNAPSNQELYLNGFIDAVKSYSVVDGDLVYKPVNTSDVLRSKDYDKGKEDGIAYIEMIFDHIGVAK